MGTFVVDLDQLDRTFSFRTFSFFSALLLCAPVDGEFKVIGPVQPIIAAPGDDIVLPCYVEPQINIEGQPVEWLKPDLQLSRTRYVYLYRDRREVRAVQIPSYVRRTALFTNELRRGNISLRILNVTLADEGRYRCFLPTLAGHRKDSVVQLVVDPNSVKSGATETPQQTPEPEGEPDVTGQSTRNHLIPVVLAVCVVACGAGGFIIKRKQHK